MIDALQPQQQQKHDRFLDALNRECEEQIDSSDLYSLAVTFYEMLTGQRPFSGGTVQNDKLDGNFTMISQMGSFPVGLDSFFRRALDPRPEKRYQNTREFMGGLDASTAN